MQLKDVAIDKPEAGSAEIEPEKNQGRVGESQRICSRRKKTALRLSCKK